MLTMSKPLSAGQAQTYHAKGFTAAEQNYWKQGNEIVGEWQGRMAGVFGLAEGVAAEDFALLSNGQHPRTQAQLVQHRQTQARRRGWLLKTYGANGRCRLMPSTA